MYLKIDQEYFITLADLASFWGCSTASAYGRHVRRKLPIVKGKYCSKNYYKCPDGFIPKESFDVEEIEDYYRCSLSNTDKTFLISKEDFNLIEGTKPYISKAGYVMIANKIYLHKQIMSDLNYHVDHINNVSTDNRRCNLRYCTKGQNAANKTYQSNRKTDNHYIGVFYCNTYKTWKARYERKGIVNIRVSTDSAFEAAIVRDYLVRKYSPDLFEKLNIPEVVLDDETFSIFKKENIGGNKNPEVTEIRPHRSHNSYVFTYQGVDGYNKVESKNYAYLQYWHNLMSTSPTTTEQV